MFGGPSPLTKSYTPIEKVAYYHRHYRRAYRRGYYGYGYGYGYRRPYYAMATTDPTMATVTDAHMTPILWLQLPTLSLRLALLEP